MSMFDLLFMADSIKEEKRLLYKMCIEKASETEHEPSRRFFANEIDKKFDVQNSLKIIDEYRQDVISIPASQVREKLDALEAFYKKYFK